MNDKINCENVYLDMNTDCVLYEETNNSDAFIYQDEEELPTVEEYFDESKRENNKLIDIKNFGFEMMQMTDKYVNFLNWTLNYLECKEIVDSDSFYYHDKDCLKYTPYEFSVYLSALCNNILSYAEKNYMDINVEIDEDDYFTQKSCYIKINKEIYLIQFIIGQDTYYHMALKREDVNVNPKNCVDYKKMMIDDKSPTYKTNAKRLISSTLNELKEKMGIEETLYWDILNEIIGEKNS